MGLPSHETILNEAEQQMREAVNLLADARDWLNSDWGDKAVSDAEHNRRARMATAISQARGILRDAYER